MTSKEQKDDDEIHGLIMCKKALECLQAVMPVAENGEYRYKVLIDLSERFKTQQATKMYKIQTASVILALADCSLAQVASDVLPAMFLKVCQAQ